METAARAGRPQDRSYAVKLCKHLEEIGALP
jgi:hypothetical protein